jgi:hypothetical protein
VLNASARAGQTDNPITSPKGCGKVALQQSSRYGVVAGIGKNSMSKNSKLKQEANRQVIMREHVLGDKTQGEVAKQLGLARQTVNENLAELRRGFVASSPEEFAVYVRQQVELLTKAIEEVWEGKLPPEAANSIRGLMDSVARLTGSNAATKSSSTNVNVNLNPEHSTDYLLFREACAGLSEDQLHEVYAVAKTLPRTWVAPPIEQNFPPPMMRELTEVTNEVE